MGVPIRRWLVGLGAVAAAAGLAPVIGHGALAAAGPIAAARSAAAARPIAAARPAAAAHPSAVTERAAPRTAAAPGYIPPGRVLTMGMHGAAVRNLQHRLAVLKYYPGRIDGQFGQNTIEAVWAFERVQGFRINSANASEIGIRMEKALVHPRLPRVLQPRGGRNLRVEINLRTEVLVLYRHNQIELISHVSSGGGYYYCSNGSCSYAITPTGNYRFHWYAPGWITVPLGMMYNSAFFIGGSYAVHGDTFVPWYPASHGCIRIPMDIAAFFHKLIHIPGTPIYIRR